MNDIKRGKYHRRSVECGRSHSYWSLHWDGHVCRDWRAALAAGKAFLKSSLKYSPKIARRMSRRGWSKQQIESTIKSAYTTAKTTVKGTGESATAYINNDGSYVVVKTQHRK
jgi:hypothetical protein